MLPTDGIQAIVANQQVMELRDGLQTEDGTWNPHSFSAIVGELGAYSLIRHAYDKQYYVHPLVHSWSQDRLPKNLQEGFCALAMHILSTAIDQMPWLKYLLPHMAQFGEKIEDHTVAHKFVHVYNEVQMWKNAEKVMAAITDQRKRTLGDKHPDILHSMNDLA